MVIRILVYSILCISLSASKYALAAELPREERSFLNMPLDEIMQGMEMERERQAQERAELPKALRVVLEFLEEADEKASIGLQGLEGMNADELMAASKEGRTILHQIASYPDNAIQIETVFEVLKDQLEPAEVSELIEKTNSKGDTALHIAAQLGNKAFFEELLKVQGFLLNLPNALGETPIYIAAERGNLPLVKLHYQNGEDICGAAHNGMTPLMASMMYLESLPVAHFLLEQDEIRECINATDHESNTALHLVALIGDPGNLAESLLRQGADTTLINEVGDTPLEIAQELAEKAKTRDQDEYSMRNAFLVKLSKGL